MVNVQAPVQFTHSCLWLHHVSKTSGGFLVTLGNIVRFGARDQWMKPGSVRETVFVRNFNQFQKEAPRLWYAELNRQRQAEERLAIRKGRAVPGAYL